MKKIILVLGLLVSMVCGAFAEVFPLEKNPIVDADIQTPYYSTGIKDKVIVQNDQKDLLYELTFMIKRYEEIGDYCIGSLSFDDVETNEDLELTKDLQYFFEDLNLNYFEVYAGDNVVLLYWHYDGEVFMTAFKMCK